MFSGEALFGFSYVTGVDVINVFQIQTDCSKIITVHMWHSEKCLSLKAINL